MHLRKDYKTGKIEVALDSNGEVVLEWEKDNGIVWFTEDKEIKQRARELITEHFPKILEFDRERAINDISKTIGKALKR